MGHFAVTAIGKDRPGIVAGLTGALRDLGGNLEDVSSTILRGHFSMMLVVDAPQEANAEHLRARLAASAEPLGVRVTVSDVEAGTPERPKATHVLSVYGSDRPGIVARFAEALAQREANITDLSCRLTAGDEPIYVLIAEVALPSAVEEEELRRVIEDAAAEAGVDATFASIEVETL